MMNVLSCLAYEHDHWLVLLASALWLMTATTGVTLARRARLGRGTARRVWLIAGGSLCGFGAWATHFIAMLAYDTAMVQGFDVRMTLTSLVLVMLSSVVSFSLCTWGNGLIWRVLAGLVFGAGAALMHFIGMDAVRLPGLLQWDPALVVASVACALLFAVPGFVLITRNETRAQIPFAASLGIMLSVLSLHFTGMAAITMQPDSGAERGGAVFSPVTMGTLIPGLALCLLALVAAASVFARRADLRLRASEEKFRVLVHGVSDYALCMLDREGRVSHWNTGAERLSGYGPLDIIGAPLAVFYSDADQEEGLPHQHLQTAARSGKYAGEGWWLTRDGTPVWAHMLIEAIRSEAGDLLGYAMITRDQTEKRRADEQLKKVSADLKLALDHMANGICLLDHGDHVVMYNRRWAQIFGIPDSTELTGLPLAEICAYNPEGSVERMEAYRGLLTRGGGQIQTALANGRILRVIVTPAHTTAWVMTVEDVTEAVQSADRIAHLARHDVLTGLPNRRQLSEGLDQLLKQHGAQGGLIAVLNIDLNRFKDINDTHGHSVGDEVLVALSQRARAVLLPGEMIGRFGGDEFVAVKPCRQREELHEFVQRLHRAFAGYVSLGSGQIATGASIGVAVCPSDGQDREKLLSNADMAMYRAKESYGQHICYFEAEMDEAERARRGLALDIWAGIESGQFFLHYQGQRAAGSHAVTGYEVLLRWTHPVQGLVPPGVFIPVAESCGAINALGEWALQQACTAAAAWAQPHKIAVNVSPLQLSDLSFVARVRQILTASGLPPGRLELEVTESTIFADKPRALQILNELRSMGVSIAIDDFGTGYSSLETLRTFPFDKIKIDRSFVADIENDMLAKAFIRAILALGKSLKIPVLAEGVETELQMRLLTEEGCDQFQGYYFGRPAALLAHSVPALI